MRSLNPFGRDPGGSRRVQPESFDVEGTIYAIGDIHGKLDLVKGLMQRIRADVERSDTRDPKTIVFMGDYIDRGEDSRGVLDYLATLDLQVAFDLPGCSIKFLRGNHEQQMLDFVDNPYGERRWLGWGGSDTLASFGFPAVFPTAGEDDYARLGEEFDKKLGDLRHFVENRTRLWWRSGNVVFSHGGMDPTLPVDKQRSKTMLWGSRAFMEQGGPPGYWHVHGHVIHPKPGIFGNRIAVDTGAYDTGKLTVARISAEGCAFMQQS